MSAVSFPFSICLRHTSVQRVMDTKQTLVSPELTLYTTNSSVLSTLRKTTAAVIIILVVLYSYDVGILDCGNEKSEIFFRFQSNQGTSLLHETLLKILTFYVIVEADSFSNAFVAAKGQIAIRPFERED